MTIALPASTAPLARRTLLRAGLLATAAVAVGVSDRVGVSRAAAGVLDRIDLRGDPRSRAARPVLPGAAAWEQLVGHEVVLLDAAAGRTVGQVVDVRDVAHPSPHVVLRGDAYSVLLDAPSLPDASSVVVTVAHEALGRPTLVLVPVNGDGSWEAVVDRRTPITTP